MNANTNAINWIRIKGGGGPPYEGVCRELGINFYISHSREQGFEYSLVAYNRDGQSLGTLGNFKTVSGVKRCAKVFGTWSN